MKFSKIIALTGIFLVGLLTPKVEGGKRDTARDKLKAIREEIADRVASKQGNNARRKGRGLEDVEAEPISYESVDVKDPCVFPFPSKYFFF